MYVRLVLKLLHVYGGCAPFEVRNSSKAVERWQVTQFSLSPVWLVDVDIVWVIKTRWQPSYA